VKDIEKKLNELFLKHRVVFWNDAEGEFEEVLDKLKLKKVKIIRPDQMGQFQAKVFIELKYSEENILVYSASCEPKYNEDWLLDVRLYSYQFRADRASMLVDELGLANHHLRNYLSSRKKFFASRERMMKLKEIIAPEDMDKDIDRKMIAVLVKSERSDWLDIIITMYNSFSESGSLDDEPKNWQQIVKMELEKSFWKFVEESFGYADEHPSLHNLLMALFVTDFAHSVTGDIPGSLRHFILPKNKQNVTVCMGQWRDSSSKTESYDICSNLVAEALSIKDKLAKMKAGNLINSVTFLEIEKTIAGDIKNRIIETADMINAGEIKRLVRKRQDMHWANRRISSTQAAPRAALHSVYVALAAAADYFALKNKYKGGFNFDNAKKMYDSYTKKLFKFDQLYRTFCENTDSADSLGWSVLKSLRNMVEDVYCNWYLSALGLSWEKCINPQSWRVADITNQYDFFDNYPKEIASKKASRGRGTAYVIVSDALRYEAAEELTRELNGKYRFSAALQSMLGVIPSYTSLGMATLLPHETIKYNNKLEVLIDGKKCASLQQRDAALASVKGMAIQRDELVSMKRDEARNLVRDKEVVYIYHKTIDAIGDTASTENKTFFGVRKALEELTNVVSYVINTLLAKYVFVTADHGFLYTETKPDLTDKNKIPEKILADIKANKRFLLGEKLPVMDGTITGKVSLTAGVDVSGDMNFILPKGMSRFYFTGGSRFFHGGASLQEVVIPVVKIENVRGKAVEQTKERKVSVQVLGTNHRITTSRCRFQILQTDAATARIKPLVIKAAVYDGDVPITDIRTVTFNSRSDNMSERTQWIMLTLQNRDYDKNKCYRFILRDAETKIEIQSVDVKIDIMLASDF
ncbi:MAG: BREX-1 system phosphatase PglZ type A, partial [Elusimicrobia bacterium]|nr:BREX-1 system phosphatase PglZ type A [Elusimicrobiota bacterium]